MKGWVLSIIIEENLFMLEFFKTFRVGLAAINDLSGKAMSVIIGIWKAETNITLAIRKKLEWHDVGEA
tara:strand:+ start:1672 stop:1875 length:204 start_codon:yes stop_codon:yes gene_type:complete